ncbi:MAG: acyl-CoA thioesterase II [Saprospiraceae bacterium]|nr:acyl-CoA thioesterase II [Saprospiraceae bacterium]
MAESKQKLEKGLKDLLKLERIEDNIFRGDSRDIGSPNVFGGQVLGQALNAAIRTVEQDKIPHSLHAYFILPGDMTTPIIYEVDRIRDGRSFTTRRVVAMQHAKPIFNLSASFQKIESGMDHQSKMPEVPPPDDLPSMSDLRKSLLKVVPEKYHRFLKPKWPIEIRLLDPVNPFRPEKKEPIKFVWMRAIERLPDDPGIHCCAMAYASDFNLLSTAMLPHGITYNSGKVRAASLDHAMWFHRSFRADEWLLYAINSPNASNARGLAMGSIFTQEGKLIATVAQEGLIRLVHPK